MDKKTRLQIISTELKYPGLGDVLKQVDKHKDKIQTILDSIENLKQELSLADNTLADVLEKKLSFLKSAMADLRLAHGESVNNLSDEIKSLRGDIKEISQRKVQIPDFASQIDALKKQLDEPEEDFQNKIDILDKEIKDLRRSTLSSLANRGGGNANRNISVNGNSSTLSRYTDLNLKAGNNISLTYTNNDNLKTTDLTIAGTGGGSGITRTVLTTSVSSVIGGIASTDYIVIAGAGIQLTLPTAVSNSNLYTIKNKAVSSIFIGTANAETIDGGANIILATQYTSVDLVSDNANWYIT